MRLATSAFIVALCVVLFCCMSLSNVFAVHVHDGLYRLDQVAKPSPVHVGDWLDHLLLSNRPLA